MIVIDLVSLAAGVEGASSAKLFPLLSLNVNPLVN